MPPGTPSGVRKGLLVNTQGTPGDDFFAPLRPVTRDADEAVAAVPAAGPRPAPFAPPAPGPPCQRVGCRRLAVCRPAPGTVRAPHPAAAHRAAHRAPARRPA